MCFFSATLHSPEVQELTQTLCERPTWVDLKVRVCAHASERCCSPMGRCTHSRARACVQGKDSVPETVFHVVVPVDPQHAPTLAAVGGHDRLARTTQFTDAIHSG